MDEDTKQTDKDEDEKVEVLKAALAAHLDIEPDKITGYACTVEHLPPNGEGVSLSSMWSEGGFWQFATGWTKSLWKMYVGAE